MSLQDVVKEIEDNHKLGVFSKSDKTMDGNHTYEIPFERKPSQQVLAQLGGIQDHKAPLLTTIKTGIKASGNPKISVTSFAPETSSSTLTIAGTVIDKLLRSARIYINTHLFPVGYYERVMSEHLSSKEDLPKENKGIAWENMAVGVCHSQEIHLLVDTVASHSHPARAHTTVLPDGTAINDETPALLLLSSPVLNLHKNHTTALKTEEEQREFITGMYRNLFHAASSQGRQYIVLPAAGLSAHGGNPKTYFNVLMSVAQEFSDLNIIYNAGDHEKDFDKALTEGFKNNTKPINVARTTKNIVFVAAQLNTQNGPCAIHNPSSSNVVYGKSDVGEHWQSAESSFINIFGKNPGKTLQAYLGTVSTAPLGSFGVNPAAFSRIVENDLDNTMVLNRSRSNSSADKVPVNSPQATKTEETHDSPTSPQSTTSTEVPVVTKPATEKLPPKTVEPSTQIPSPQVPSLPKQEGTTKKTDKSSPDVPVTTSKTSTTVPRPTGNSTTDTPTQKSVPVTDDATKASKPAAIDTPKPADKSSTAQSSSSGKITGPGASGIFPPSPTPNKPTTNQTTASKSSLSKEQIKEINKTIYQLTREVLSCWPYPNKSLKQVKIQALDTLIENAKTMSVAEAVAAVKTVYPNATQGRISTRTADLFHKLENPPANMMSL